MKRRILVTLLILTILVIIPTIALADNVSPSNYTIFLPITVSDGNRFASLADGVPSFVFTTPLFGLDVAPDGSLLVADAGAGIVELRKGAGSIVAQIPGVTDIASIGRGDMFAVTGGGESDSARKLYRISRGGTRELADLGAFEADVNPDGGEIDSNPFDVAALTGGQALVADAGGNDLLIVDQRGKVDWVATLPDQIVPTDNIKT